MVAAITVVAIESAEAGSNGFALIDIATPIGDITLLAKDIFFKRDFSRIRLLDFKKPLRFG